MSRRRLLAGLLLLGLVTACSSGATPGPSPSTVVTTRTLTSSAAPYEPPPATTVAGLPPSAGPTGTEKSGPCPYISAGSVEDIVGSHVYRTTVLTADKPAGCRFYFYAPPYGALADIVPTTFASPVAAHNAAIATGEQGTQVIGQPDLAPGVEGVSFRTAFYGPDHSRDWACAFATGDVMVVVHTQRTDTAAVAVLLARAVVAKF